MSSIVRLYGSKFRQELSYHPVWQPGVAIVAGDYGVLNDNVFIREGNIREYSYVPHLIPQQKRIDGVLKFNVGAKVTLSGGANAQVDPSVSVGGALSFGAEGGVVFHAITLVQLGVDNLREVLRALPWDTDDWRETLFVSEVILAQSAAVIVAETGGTTLALNGKASALSALDLGDASVSFGASQAAYYAMPLRSGAPTNAVALRLYKWKRGMFGSGLKLLGVRSPVNPLDGATSQDPPRSPDRHEINNEDFDELSPDALE